MTNQDNTAVLERAIRVAVKNGWKRTYTRKQMPELNFEEVYGVIYNHEFAKSLWPIDGMEHVTTKAAKATPIFSGKPAFMRRPSRPLRGSWQYHLQQMVISPDPIQYLAANMPGGEE